MRVRSEPATGLLVVEPAGVRFQLDGANGTAALALGGRRFRLRPLRWSEKLRLARFSHLGPDFLDAQLVRIGLGDAPAPEPTSTDHAVLLAIARWLNGLAADPTGLPLDPALLATVTLEVCRALGGQPTGLAACDAAEVEQLWSGVRAASRTDEPARAEPSSGRQPGPALGEGLTRIVVLPDPEHDQAPAAAAARASQASSSPEPPVAGPAPRDPAAGPATGRPASRAALAPTDAASPASPPAPARAPRFRVVDPAAVFGGREATRPTAASGGAAPSRPADAEPGLPSVPPSDAGQALPSPRPAAARPDAAPVGDPFRATGQSGLGAATALAAPIVAPPRPLPHGAPAAASPFARTGRPDPAPIDDGADAATAGVGAGAPRIGDGDAADPSVPARPAAARPLPTVDRDALFEAFGEQLEQAADELGIDVRS